MRSNLQTNWTTKIKVIYDSDTLASGTEDVYSLVYILQKRHDVLNHLTNGNLSVSNSMSTTKKQNEKDLIW